MVKLVSVKTLTCHFSDHFSMHCAPSSFSTKAYGMVITVGAIHETQIAIFIVLGRILGRIVFMTIRRRSKLMESNVMTETAMRTVCNG